MLEALRFENVGPAPELDLKLKPRMNFLVGDNGLGKSFLLDVAWWALTHTWAREIVRPHRPPLVPTISCRYTASSAEKFDFTSTYDRDIEKWTTEKVGPPPQGLVLYAQVDGAFSVRDPARNYWGELPGRPAAYLFSASEIWDGNSSCEGLIRDWGSWQREGSTAFAALKKVLHALSPSSDELLSPGELRRLSLDDPKDYPTLSMPYGEDVIVVHASAGMRRAIALAYLLVWTWREHLAACELRGSPPAREIVFLVDEVESHLHPQWQRRIVPALLDVMDTLTGAHSIEIQLIVATHSPLVLASTENRFDPERDAISVLDLIDRCVRLEVSPWRRRGDANNWLSSSLFDLREPRSLESERALVRARSLIQAYRLSRRPTPLPESVRNAVERRARQDQERVQQQREEHEHNLRVLNENLELIRSGEHRNLLSWLCRVASHDGLHLTISLDKLREKFGDVIADAASAGLKACWRQHRPPFTFEQESRTIITGDVRIGLAGLALAFANGLDPAALDESEVDLATRYALHELNGFPPWFEALAQAHPDQVIRALRPAVDADLRLLEAEDHPELLVSKTFEVPKVLRLSLARVVLDVLEQHEPSHLSALQEALQICRWLDGSDVPRFAAVCEGRSLDTREPQLAVSWWCAWIRLAPHEAVSYLEEFAADAAGEDLDTIVESIAASLGAWPSGTHGVGALATDVMALEHLIPIVHGSIRLADDQDLSEGARFITSRDHAQAFRDGLVELLTTSGNPEAAATLERLARDFSMQSQREDLLERARLSRQSSRQAQPMSEAEAIGWMRKVDAAGLNETGRVLLAQLDPSSSGTPLVVNHRFTIEHTRDKSEEPYSKRHRLSWDDLLEHRWVAICSGSEHVDLQRQAATLRREGKISICIEISTLAQLGNAGVLLDHEQFTKWRDGDEQGFLFLNWAHERPSEELLQRALAKLHDYVGTGTARSRLRLVVSCRSDFAGLQSDRHAIEKFAGRATRTRSLASTGPDKLEISDTLNARSDTQPQAIEIESEPERDVSIVIARPEPLEEAEMRRIAKERLGSEDARHFMAAVELAGAHGLISSSGEVAASLDYWRAHRRIGTRAEIIERSVGRLLDTTRLDEPPSSSLTWADCCEGFARLLTVAVLSARHSFTFQDERSELREQSEPDAIHPIEVLEPWSVSRVKELMGRSVFDAASSGHAAYLSQTEARAYMAAKWLDDRCQRGMPVRELSGLFFREVSGQTVVPNHLAETLAWCSLWNGALLSRTMEVDPAISLRYGDQTSLSHEQREQLLTAYLERPDRRDLSHRRFDTDALHRFSLGLDDSVARHLSRESLSPASIEFLLALATAGGLHSCRDHALAWARDINADHYVRRGAFRAVRALADDDQQREFVKELSAQTERWDQELAGEFASLFYPTMVGTSALSRLLRHVVPASPTHGSAIKTFLYYELVDKCPTSDRLAMLTALTDVFGEASPDLKSQLRHALRGLVTLVVEGMALQDEPPAALQQALTRLDAGDRDRDRLPHLLATRPRVQRWLFWHRVYTRESKIGSWPNSDYERERVSKTPLVPSDAQWLATDVHSHERAEAREYAFRTLLSLAQEHPEVTTLVTELTVTNPNFAMIAQTSVPLVQRYLKDAERVDEALRASLGDTDPFWLRWSAFKSELEGNA
jgi:hypothetical protein